MTVEKRLERKLARDIKKLGGLALKLQSFSFLGLPDRLILLPIGRVKFCELKSTGVKPTRRQLYVHSLLRNLGFEVWVVDSDENYKELINSL